MVVIGPHRRQLLRDFFTGTTAERTIRAADRPILMANAPPAASYRRILIATDLSDASAQAIKGYFGLELGRTATATALYVFDAPALGLMAIGGASDEDRRHYLDSERHRASVDLSRSLASIDGGHLDQIVRLQTTCAADGILAQARDMAADLIVVGTRGQSGFVRFVLGSVAEQVLRSADSDVLAIPGISASE